MTRTTEKMFLSYVFLFTSLLLQMLVNCKQKFFFLVAKRRNTNGQNGLQLRLGQLCTYLFEVNDYYDIQI